MRTWIKQAENSNTCGQIALAVIAGISLEESIKIVGKKGCTKTKDLVLALRKLGYQCPDRCRKMERPTLGLAQVRTTDRSGWHWVVVSGDKIFDGAFGTPEGAVKWPSGWKLTSFLPITERNK